MSVPRPRPPSADSPIPRDIIAAVLRKIFAARTNQIIFALGLLALLAGAAYFWQRQAADQRAAAAAIRQETVQQGTIVATVSATGYLTPQTQVNLFFTAAAPLAVTEVNVVLGQPVRRGEVLARLDDRDLALAVAQAEQSLNSAQLRLAQLLAPPRPADLALAEANLRLARAQVSAASQGQSAEAKQIAWLNLQLARQQLDQTYTRMQRLEDGGRFGDKLSLQPQADQLVQDAKVADLRWQAAGEPPNSGPAASAMAAVAQAQAALDKLKNPGTTEDVQIAKLQVSQAQSALDLAQHNLEEAQIRAPFDGVVAAVNLHVGELAAGGLPAVVLVDVSRFYLDVAVDELDVASVAAGQAVTVTLDALPNALLTGTVQKIAPTATNNAGVVSYGVRLSLDSSNEPLRGGLTATAAIVVAEARAVPIIPNWAIRRDRTTGQAFAGLLRDGKITDVPVELGLRNETYSEVRSGLNVGEVVAVDTRREEFKLIGGG